MGKVALVTGASRGIGKVIAAHLALRGLDVAVAARSVSERDVTPYPGTIHATAALIESLGARRRCRSAAISASRGRWRGPSSGRSTTSGGSTFW